MENKNETGQEKDKKLSGLEKTLIGFGLATAIGSVADGVYKENYGRTPADIENSHTITLTEKSDEPKISNDGIKPATQAAAVVGAIGMVGGAALIGNRILRGREEKENNRGV